MPESFRAQVWSLGFALCCLDGRLGAVRLFNTADTLKWSFLSITNFQISEETSGIPGPQLLIPRNPW